MDIKTRLTELLPPQKRVILIGNRPNAREVPGIDIVCRLNDARENSELYAGRTDILFVNPVRAFTQESWEKTRAAMESAKAVVFLVPGVEALSIQDVEMLSGKDLDVSSLVLPVGGLITSGGLALVCLTLACNAKMITCTGMANADNIGNYLLLTGRSECLDMEKAIRSMHLMA
jgi:hypothetical protein